MQTLIDGVSSPGVMNFPVGVNVTYICTVQAAAHRWSASVSTLSVTRSITTLDPVAIQPPFTIRLLMLNGSNLISSLSFTTYIGLNGSEISCINSLIPDGEVQGATVIVTGEHVL